MQLVFHLHSLLLHVLQYFSSFFVLGRLLFVSRSFSLVRAVFFFLSFHFILFASNEAIYSHSKIVLNSFSAKHNDRNDQTAACKCTAKEMNWKFSFAFFLLLRPVHLVRFFSFFIFFRNNIGHCSASVFRSFTSFPIFTANRITK